VKRSEKALKEKPRVGKGGYRPGWTAVGEFSDSNGARIRKVTTALRPPKRLIGVGKRMKKKLGTCEVPHSGCVENV